VVAGGTLPLSYQWQHNGAAIPGAINATLTITGAQSADGGIYRVTISNPCGSVDSAPVTLAVECGSKYYVSTTGSDANPGTIGLPFRHIQKALDTVVAGDSVYIFGGIYRETGVLSGTTSGASNNLITVSAYSNDVVVIKGSEVVTGWTYVTNGIWMRTNWPFNSQQVFVHGSTNFADTDDGYPLQQVGMPNERFSGNGYQWYTWMYDPPNRSAATTVTDSGGTTVLTSVDQALTYMATNPGTFFNGGFSNGVYTGTTLYIHLSGNADPRTKGIEASVRGGIANGLSYYHLKNLRFRHSNVNATTAQWMALVVGKGSIVECCDVEWCDFGGLNAIPAQVINCNMNNNGDFGGAGSYVYGCTATNNNYRNFSQGWHCAGIGKYAFGTNDYGPVTIECCTVARNNAPGIWFDGSRNGCLYTIRNNTVSSNGAVGIFIEITTNAWVYNNLLIGNWECGVFVSGSQGTKVYNNTVVGTRARSNYPTTAGIIMGGVPRKNGTNWFALVNNEFKNNIVWNSETWWDIVIMTNTASYWWTNWDGNGSIGFVICSNNVVDSNCYFSTNRITCGVCSPVTNWPHTLSLDPEGMWYGPGDSRFNTCTNLPAWTAMTHYDSNSLSCDPQFVNAAAGDYRLSPTSPLIDKGQTLPIVPFDYQGIPRPLGAGYDIGAYER
jgi:parallel beta-helix repeat protein